MSMNENEVKKPAAEDHEEVTKNALREKDFDGVDLYLYNNVFWCHGAVLKPMISFQNNFKAKSSDIILAPSIKCGTTWLKALTPTILNRAKYTKNTIINPLLTTHPHYIVLNLEYQIYLKDENPNLDHLPSPRIFQTHVPFSALPKSILDSKCRIIHICRNPLDQFVSYWNFILRRIEKEREVDAAIKMPHIDEAFELFCRGVHLAGPFWENTLGYWRASIENPERVLFLRYEDLKDDINSQVKKIAEFLGVGFSAEEENQGVISEISNFCSFENLVSLPANQEEGRVYTFITKSYFFRKGLVGDWVNYLSPSQAKTLEDITKQKFEGSGLTFKTFFN